MYWVKIGYVPDPAQIHDGCLVLSMTNAGTPEALGWSSGLGPNSCAGLPNTDTTQTWSTALTWSDLDGAVQTGTNGAISPNCNSWGEPAMMVGPAPNGSGNAAFLAAICFNSSGVALGSPFGDYFFYNSSYNQGSGQRSGFLTADDWTYLSGPFGVSALPNNPYSPESVELTKLDWAVRADSSVVAVATPFDVASSPPVEYGCWALNLNLLGSGSPFTSVAAIAEDSDTDGPNGTTRSKAQAPAPTSPHQIPAS
jgi:hypothetical protein